MSLSKEPRDPSEKLDSLRRFLFELVERILLSPTQFVETQQHFIAALGFIEPDPNELMCFIFPRAEDEVCFVNALATGFHAASKGNEHARIDRRSIRNWLDGAYGEDQRSISFSKLTVIHPLFELLAVDYEELLPYIRYAIKTHIPLAQWLQFETRKDFDPTLGAMYARELAHAFSSYAATGTYGRALRSDPFLDQHIEQLLVKFNQELDVGNPNAPTLDTREMQQVLQTLMSPPLSARGNFSNHYQHYGSR